MSARKAKQEIVDRFYIGLVEDNIDPKRKGRIKVRIDRLHGKKDDTDSIPTEDLPWAVPIIGATGGAFSVPANDKVVYISHIEGDFYSPEYFNAEHYNLNLQDKLQSFNDDGYENFYAVSYDDKHQYYHEKGKGVVFDFVKSNMNLKENGDIQMNLRDNDSKLYLGTEDASQQAVLGNHWMNWFDEFVQNLLGAKGGPYLGNFGAPVIPNPGMIEVMNKYLAIRETFLSDHVYIVDDFRVKAQTREFDKEQHSDNFNDENLEPTNNAPARGYEPQDRAPGSDGADIKSEGTEPIGSSVTNSTGTDNVSNAGNQLSSNNPISDVESDLSSNVTNTATDNLDSSIVGGSSVGESKDKKKGVFGDVAAGVIGGAVLATGFVKGMPKSTYSDNLPSSRLPLNPTDDEKKKTIKPFDDPNFSNGTIPVEKMTASKYLKSTFPGDDDERKYLLDEASRSLDNWLDQYHLMMSSNMPKILAVKGYQNRTRQNTIRTQYPSLAPKAGTDPFGFANQVELWLSIDKGNVTLVNKIKNLLRTNILSADPSPQEKSLKLLIDIGRKNRWRLAGRTSIGDLQWWHWIYDPTINDKVEGVENEGSKNKPKPTNSPKEMSKDAISQRKKKRALRKAKGLSIIEKIKNKDIVQNETKPKKDFETFAIRFNASKSKKGFNKKIKFKGKETTIKNYLISYFKNLEIDFDSDNKDNPKRFRIKNIQEHNKYTEEFLLDGIREAISRIKLEFKESKSKRNTHFFNIFNI